jgi:hypothetical protein
MSAFRTLPCKIQRKNGGDYVSVERQSLESYFLVKNDTIKKGEPDDYQIRPYNPFIIEPAPAANKWQLKAYLLAPYGMEQAALAQPDLVMGELDGTGGRAGLVPPGSFTSDMQVIRGECSSMGYTVVSFKYEGDKFLQVDPVDNNYYIRTVTNMAAFPATACFKVYEMPNAGTQNNHLELLSFVSHNGCDDGYLIVPPPNEDPVQFETDMRVANTEGCQIVSGAGSGAGSGQETTSICEPVCMDTQKCIANACVLAPPPPRKNDPWWMYVGIGAILLLVIAAVGFFMNRPRRRKKVRQDTTINNT